MNKRLRKKVSHVWSTFTLGERKHAPYRRDQLWEALGRRPRLLPQKPWPFARRGPKYRPTPDTTPAHPVGPHVRDS